MTNELFNKKIANIKNDFFLGLLLAFITVAFNTVLFIIYQYFTFNIILIVLFSIITISFVFYAVYILVRGLKNFSMIHANVLGEKFIFEPVGKYTILNEEYDEKCNEVESEEFDEKAAAEAKEVEEGLNKFLKMLNTDEQYYEDFIQRFNCLLLCFQLLLTLLDFLLDIFLHFLYLVQFFLHYN